MSDLKIGNREFRRALISLCGLSAPVADDPLPAPTTRAGSAWARDMIRRLGFVQIDPICAVERAHHHILFSRNPRYRQDDLRRLLEDERAAFENWTHDAAILPIETYPYWKHFFERQRNYDVHPGYRRYFGLVTDEDIAFALRRVTEDGPLRPRDLETRRIALDHAYFAQPTAAKLALEWLWRTGTLAITRRESRQKVYDLAERVVPAALLNKQVSRRAYVDWACRESLLRLGAAAPARIAACFDAVSTDEAAAWCTKRLGKDVVRVRVTQPDGDDGATQFALLSFADTLRKVPAPPRRLRVLNPFDPLIHDRRRTQRVFGFDYTIEIWVPERKRKYGYYVLPILEGERFTGRADCKLDRKKQRLLVLGLWWEPGVRPSRARAAALEAELHKLAVFAGAEGVSFSRAARRAVP